jgi:hypothetical protein
LRVAKVSGLTFDLVQQNGAARQKVCCSYLPAIAAYCWLAHKRDVECSAPVVGTSDMQADFHDDAIGDLKVEAVTVTASDGVTAIFAVSADIWRVGHDPSFTRPANSALLARIVTRMDSVTDTSRIGIRTGLESQS